MAVTNLDTLKLDKTAKVAAADAVASVAVPTKAEFDAVVALANEMKAKLNAIFQA